MRRRAAVSGGLALAVTAALLALGLATPIASAATPDRATVATVRTAGYLTMADGTELAYTVVRPARAGHYPTLFEYSGYFPGRAPDPKYVQRFVERGGDYAYIGVNLRGTGCSSGTFDFFQPQEAVDGAAVIAWIRQQGWSNGTVGMIGKSYPGITQLFVAAQHPVGLAAIAPGHFFADAYRDVARPGGIANHGFAALWSFIGRPSYEFLGGPDEVANGDLGCLRGTTGEITGLATNPYVQLQSHPYDDALFEERSPERFLPELAGIPMLATLAWQDEQLASRQTHLLAELDDLGADRWWATLTNGDHDMARTDAELEDLARFYDHFLRAVDNGWGTRPRVQVWWDAGRNGTRAPGWVTGLDHWSESRREAAGTLQPRAFALREGGSLTGEPAVPGEAASTYAYAPFVGTEGPVNPRYAYASLPDQYLWSVSPPPGTAAAFTTPPLDEDLTLLGSASADLWISATAPEVDLQVTLTEVRPDGQEEFVEQGWLRASQRRLDPAKSTALRPYQTHAQADVAPLVPGTPVLARVEVFPFGHVFRAGSRLRMWVEAPAFLPALWAFTASPVPAVVTVLHDPQHPSRLVLPEVPDDPERIATLPACGSLIRQPCRPDPLPAATPVRAQPAGAPPTSTTTPTAPGGSPPGPRGHLPTTGGTGALAAGGLLLALGLATSRVARARRAT